jgi:hypothetical protein
VGLLCSQALLFVSVVLLRRNTSYLSAVFALGGDKPHAWAAMHEGLACMRVLSSTAGGGAGSHAASMAHRRCA